MYFLLTYDLELKQAILVRSFNLKNFTIDFNKGEEAKHAVSVVISQPRWLWGGQDINILEMELVNTCREVYAVRAEP